MKKIISLLLIAVFAIGLFGCSENSNTITIYEFKEDYEVGTPITKSMFKARKISLVEGFVASDGRVYTQEKLSGIRLVTSDNWNELVSKESMLAQNYKKGQLLRVECVTDEPIMVNVVRLAQNVDEGVRIQSEHLEIITTRKDSVPTGIINDPNKIIGRHAATTLYAGDYLVEEDLVGEPLSVTEIQHLHDFEEVASEYCQARTLYEQVLKLDYRIAAGIEDPLLIAPEYEAMLDQIESLVLQCQALSVATEYTQLHAMITTWVTTDIAVYCQRMYRAITMNDVTEHQRALDCCQLVYNDFAIITETIIAKCAVINGAEIKGKEERVAVTIPVNTIENIAFDFEENTNIDVYVSTLSDKAQLILIYVHILSVSKDTDGNLAGVTFELTKSQAVTVVDIINNSKVYLAHNGDQP